MGRITYDNMEALLRQTRQTEESQFKLFILKVGIIYYYIASQRNSSLEDLKKIVAAKYGEEAFLLTQGKSTIMPDYWEAEDHLKKEVEETQVPQVLAVYSER